MAIVPDDAPGDEPPSGAGWTAQLIDVIRRAILAPDWGPTLRISLLAVIGVLLYLAVVLLAV